MSEPLTMPTAAKRLEAHLGRKGDSGLGFTLLTEVIAEAKKEGAREAWLDTAQAVLNMNSWEELREWVLARAEAVR